MSTQKIYPLFLNKIETQKDASSNDNKEYRVIISFPNLTERDKFLSKHKQIKILNTFDFIPGICTWLNKDEILNFDKEVSIKQIEEDQQLFLSLLEVSEILELDKYKKSQISYMGKNVKVGIVDNGINRNFKAISKVLGDQLHKHEDDKGEITHGTIMASIIANQFKNPEDVYVGIAPDVKIIDFNLSHGTNEYFFSNILEVFDLIIKDNVDIDVLLISFTTSEGSDGRDILSLAANILVDHGIIIVSPAGNYGPNLNTIGSPSAASKVISFGALSKNLSIEEFSGKGPTIDDRIKPDFSLPGSSVKIPLSHDFIVNASGTSVSAAIGAGLIAIIKDYKSDLTYNTIFELLKTSCKDLRLENTAQGYGMPSILKIFKNLDLFQERILPYNILIKRAIMVSIEFSILLIVINILYLIFRSL